MHLFHPYQPLNDLSLVLTLFGDFVRISEAILTSYFYQCRINHYILKRSHQNVKYYLAKIQTILPS